jgi:hypothetical protein
MWDRRDRAEQAALISHNPEIADHLSAVGDRTRQFGQHPAAVMNQQPLLFRHCRGGGGAELAGELLVEIGDLGRMAG